MNIEKFEKRCTFLNVVSIVVIAYIIGNVKIAELNLAFGKIENLGGFTKIGLGIVLVYLLWGYLQGWIALFRNEWRNNVENSLKAFLTTHLVSRINIEGTGICDVDQTQAKTSSRGNFSAESSHFIYSKGWNKGSPRRSLRVQLQQLDQFNNLRDVQHVVHHFEKSEFIPLLRKFWFHWVLAEPFFRAYLLPAIIGGIALFVLVLDLGF
jgi:hypothetical protein